MNPAVSTAPILSRRQKARSANSNLYRQGKTWWVNYTVYPTPIEKARVRKSLGTRDLDEARARRDALFAELA